MAAAMAQMTSTSAVLGGLSTFTPAASRKLISSRVAPGCSVTRFSAGRVRYEAGKGLREVIDESTKKEITEAEILRNQETNESEQRSYFGAKPTARFDQAVGFTPRLEMERQPEARRATSRSSASSPSTVRPRR